MVKITKQKKLTGKTQKVVPNQEIRLKEKRTAEETKSADKAKQKKPHFENVDAPPMEIEYKLNDLPSAQHKAGLAGLKLMVDWLERSQEEKGLCEIKNISNNSLILSLTKPGLTALLNEVYDATQDETVSEKPYEYKEGKNVLKLPFNTENGYKLKINTAELVDNSAFITVLLKYDTLPPFLKKAVVSEESIGETVRYEFYLQKSKIKDLEKYLTQFADLECKNEFTLPRLPIRTVEERDENGKPVLNYIYHGMNPKGAFLTESSPSDAKQLWVKLWRNMMWATIHPKKRDEKQSPWGKRSRNEDIQIEEEWQKLSSTLTETVALGRTRMQFLGVEDKNAEMVQFKDQNRTNFLLHFWRFIAQVYAPFTIKIEHDKDAGYKKESKPAGFVIAIPEITDLKYFCEKFPIFMTNRSVEAAGYRPRDSCILLPAEGPLESLNRMRMIVGERDDFFSMISGMEVYHLEKQGKSIRNRGNFRVFPDSAVLNEYAFVKKRFWDDLFRKQVTENILYRKRWESDFVSLFLKFPYQYFLNGNQPDESPSFSKSHFPHDAKEFFLIKEQTMKDENRNFTTETLVYDMIRSYISSKLETKYELSWETVKDDPEKKKKYQETKHDIALKTFLALRSRSGQDFVSYFSGTICSTPQYLDEHGRFLEISKALYEETEKIRTLSMLALSALSYQYESQKKAS